MKKWSVLSIPMIGLAGLGIWAQSLVAAPTNQPTGVVVADPAASSRVSGSSAPAPASRSSASAPGKLRSDEALRRLDMAEPQTTEQAEAQGPDGDGRGNVQLVEPTQVTSPAAPPPDGSPSAPPPDGSPSAGPDDGSPSAGPDDKDGRDDREELADSGGGKDD